MFTKAPRRGWYPTATVAGTQSSNIGFNHWFWLSIFLLFIVIILVLLILHFYARCIFGRQRAHTGNVRATTVSPRSEPLKPGLDLSVISTIPTFAYINAGKVSRSAIECAICLGVVEEGEMVRQLPRCKHVFHVGCTDKWLQSHGTCPVCRADAGPVVEEAALRPASSSEEEEKDRRLRMWWTGRREQDIERQ